MTRPLGLKFDDGKLAYHLQDEDADAEMTAVLTFGAVLYEPGNWEFVEGAVDRYFNALRRHLRESRRGEVLDPETGLLTLAAAACNVHFLLAFELKKHPELVASFPERLKESLRRAREMREARLSAASTRVDEPAPVTGWDWTLVDVPTGSRKRRRKSRTGQAASRSAADRAAHAELKKTGWPRAKILLSERRAAGFSVEALGIQERGKKRQRRR